MLCQDFINFIKQKFISSRGSANDLPALRQLVPRVSMEVVFAEVDSVFVQDPAFSRNLKIYLCHRYTAVKGVKSTLDSFYCFMHESAMAEHQN